MSSISNVGLQEVSLSGHLGAKEHPDTSSIKLGGSPSRERNFFFSPTTEGVSYYHDPVRDTFRVRTLCDGKVIENTIQK